jgi:hypothetical protein
VVIFDSSPFEQAGNLIDLGYKLNENNQAHKYQQKPLRGLFETTNLPPILACPHRLTFGTPDWNRRQNNNNMPSFICADPRALSPAAIGWPLSPSLDVERQWFLPAIRFPLRPSIGASTKPSSDKDAATIYICIKIICTKIIQRRQTGATFKNNDQDTIEMLWS